MNHSIYRESAEIEPGAELSAGSGNSITKVEQPLRAARIKGLLLKHFCVVPGGPVMPTVGLGMDPISQTKRHLGWSPLKRLLNNS